MSAKLTYTKGGTDPSPINWPPNAPPAEQFTFTTGATTLCAPLIAYPGTGHATYPDGRQIPQTSPQGSVWSLQFP